MPASTAPHRRLAAIALGLTTALTPLAHARLYKCEQADGVVTYQQTACGGHADAEVFEVDTRGPDGSRTGSVTKDYSVRTQAAEMRAARARVERARQLARDPSAAGSPRATGTTGSDKAKCAKHRAEHARWRQEVMNGYKKRTEKEYQEGKLAYHEALVERYCD